MKKIGILTFHWATNFGAVLQAYALQKYLESLGYAVEIINYRPLRTLSIQLIGQIKSKKVFSFYKKENAINSFRKKNFKLSKITVHNSEQLKKLLAVYDVIITGSDQIWNESFTLGAEGKPTLSYFADGAPDSAKRISYAASFGTSKVSPRYKDTVKGTLAKFTAISVREESGISIVNDLGFNATRVCDPTALLHIADYENLIGNQTCNHSKMFSYILHGHAESVKISDYIRNVIGGISSATPNGIEEWLQEIKNTDLVVTNSFHGIMLSIIFNTPFVAVLIKGSGMNDRISTILSEVGLNDRIIEEYDEAKIEDIIGCEIEWQEVNNKLQNLRETGVNFLKKELL